jgi:hypothetical protein
MSRRRWVFVGLSALTLLAIALLAVFAGQQPARASALLTSAEAPQEQAVPGQYMWNYSVKFVCGFQPPLKQTPGVEPLGEPVVKPANYATDINIHNYNYKTVPLRKKLLVLVETTAAGQNIVREPKTTEPRAFAQVVLGPDFATLDDCNGLWGILHPNIPPPATMLLFTGYLVILSPLDIDVDVVYTAATPWSIDQQPGSISEDVERVTGKRVFVPQGALPND